MSTKDEQEINETRSLIANLLDSKEYTQVSISKDTGVDQSVICRLFTTKRKRMTKNLYRLKDYAIMRNNAESTPTSVTRHVSDFLKSGGRPELLIRQIRLLQDARDK